MIKALSWPVLQDDAHNMVVITLKACFARQKGICCMKNEFSSLGNQVSQTDIDVLPRTLGMRGNEIADHVARNAVAEDIPVDRTDRLKLVAKKLGWEEENACVDNTYLQRMEDRGGRRGKEVPGVWLTEFEITRTNDWLVLISVYTLLWLLEQRVEHVWVCPDCSDADFLDSSFKF